MMFRRIVLLCRMALHTNVVAGRSKLEAVGLVTIAAGYARVEHPTLNERAVFVVLLFYLAIGKVVVAIEQRNAVVMAYGLAVDEVFANLSAPRVASRVNLYFSVRLTRLASKSLAGAVLD